jgi:hypothetical protein
LQNKSLVEAAFLALARFISFAYTPILQIFRFKPTRILSEKIQP